MTWLEIMCAARPEVKQCSQSPHFEPVNMLKGGEKVHRTCMHHSLPPPPSPQPHISLWSARFEVPQECPLAQDNNHISVWVAGGEMNSRVGLQGLKYYFVRTNTACSSPHSFTSSDWCWQFPQTKLCHSETWSMALISKILTTIRPQSNLFLPTTENFWRPRSTQSSSRAAFFYGSTFAASSVFNPYSRN